MRPIIGILAEVSEDKDTRVLYPYVNSIESAGGVPVILPYIRDADTLEGFLRICDGFLFTGGVDVDPSRYGEAMHPMCGELQLYRDELEFKVFRKVIGTGKPILAICRGAQLVNVALGGKLYQDIPSEIPSEIAHRQVEPRFSPSHSVRVISDTPLHSLVGCERMTANSFHHQSVSVLGRELRVMAVADDGIIEAFYHTGEQYIRAYQWHPERLFETDGGNRLIFEDFIKAAS